MGTGDRIKILVADDQEEIRTMLHALLELYPEIDVVGEAENGIEALQKVREFAPDVLLLDIHMPVIDGIETLEILRKTDDQTCVIMFSGFENKFFLYEAITKGANGYIMKDDPPDLLVESILNCVRGNKLVLSPQITLGKISGDYSTLF
jgi:DNA-binding NarL/FixJ family response regulator